MRLPVPSLSLQPFRQALRSLRRSPGFTVTVLVLLTLGIGAASGLVAASDVLLFEPLPFASPDRIVQLAGLGKDREPTDLSLLEALDLGDRAKSFSAVGAYRLRSFGMAGGTGEGDSPVTVVQVGMVTPGFFEALGVRPLWGRTFGSGDSADAERTVVLTEDLRRRQLASSGGDGRAVGRTIELNDEPFTVIGVVPRVELPMAGHVPNAFIALDPGVYGKAWTQRSLQAVARLAPGATVRSARVELGVLGHQMAAAHPELGENLGFGLETLDESLKGASRRPLALLGGAAAVLLLIVLANLASLLIVRQRSRLHGAAVRAALGAGTGHLLRSALAESLVLAAGGALLGLFVAHAVTSLLPQTLELLGQSGSASVRAARLDLAPGETTLLVTLAIAVGLALFLGLVSATTVRRAERSGLRRLLEGGLSAAGEGPHAGRFQTALVVIQVALSVVLVASSGLLLRSLDQLLSIDPGFDATGVLSFGIGLPDARYDSREMVRFHRRLSRSLEALPGVEEAGIVAPLPFAGSYHARFIVKGRPASEEEKPSAALSLAAPGAFEALHVAVVGGRLPEWRDGPDSPPVLVVNRSFRERYLPDGAVGQHLLLSWYSDLTPRGRPWEIVGVVDDVRQEGLDLPPTPQIYLPASQFPLDGGVYVVRTTRTDADLSGAIRQTVRTLDPRLEKIEVRKLTEVLGEKLAARRSALGLLGAFAVTALLLTGVGLYGLLAFQVAERRAELAVRMGLGATPRKLVRLVAGRVLALVATGLALGLAGSVVTGRALESRLYEVSATDPPTLVATALVLVIVALVASVVPALRAAGVEPREVLS